MQSSRRIIIGITGATGIIYAVRLLEALRELAVETHLVISRAAEMTIAYECDLTPKQIRHMASACYAAGDVGAAISSGSFKTMGMIVAPCSMRSLAEIASGTTTTLLTRAADVCLKERRRLVLMTRETPLHLGHLRAMAAVTEMGGIIYPPVPAFYAKPLSLGEMVAHTVGRVLGLFDLDPDLPGRWRGGAIARPSSDEGEA
jgi:4-hydroxy-3-polyprenylbenzoate decarboxylase